MICKEALDLIKSFEECRLTAYEVKPELYAIGWGTTNYEDGGAVKPGDVITQERADELLKTVVAMIEERVWRACRFRLTDNQLGALTCFAYSVRPGTFQQSNILAQVNRDPADLKLRRIWMYENVRPGSTYEKELRRRREQEVDLYFKK